LLGTAAWIIFFCLCGRRTKEVVRSADRPLGKMARADFRAFDANQIFDF
jgi:hypothetical protein